jgi:hypothetical protein
VLNPLNLHRNGAVGFIDWLGPMTGIALCQLVESDEMDVSITNGSVLSSAFAFQDAKGALVMIRIRRC